jgi:Disulphide bond corrector protein DsbC
MCREASFSRMDIKLRLWLRVFLLGIFLSAISVACASVASEPISLVSFTENYVDVSIYLTRDAQGNYVLSGTFTPPEGYHLYSKDIPLNGVRGLGRPTLLELTTNSHLRSNGELMESVKAEKPDFEPKELLVYPLGEVTLSLPVELPSGKDWINEEIKVTYMACSASLCKPPLVGKIVSIRIPGTEAVK